MKETTANLTLAEAVAKRDILIARAASGENITTHQLRAAEQAVRDSETDAVLAGAVGQHQKATAEREWIAAHVEAGAALLDQLAIAMADDMKAARELDNAIAAARAAAERKNAAAQAIAEADRRLREHNCLLEAAAQSNAVLAAIPRQEWPRLSTLTAHGLNVGAPLRVEIVQFKPGWQPEKNGCDVVVLKTAEQTARQIYGLLAPAVSELVAA